MKAAIEFQILGRETEEIGGGRGGHGLTQNDVEVVAVAEGGPTGAEREVVEYPALRRLCREPVAGLETPGSAGVRRRIGDVAQHIRSVKAAGVDGVNDHAGLVRTVDDIHAFGEELGQDKTGRDENELALAGHDAQAAQS